MTPFEFKPASRKKAKGRIALVGPSGSGKTLTALLLAKQLGDRIAVIDTEHGSASKYAGDMGHFDVPPFDVLELTSFSPDSYVEAIHAAENAGYEVINIDSLTHAWAGKDGALEQVDKAAARSRSGNKFTAWRDVTPMHTRLIDAMIGSRCHIIATMRAKTEWVLEEDEKGKKVPRRLGLAPVQRDGMEYEFDVLGDMDLDNRLVISKSRLPALQGTVILKPGAALGAQIRAWLDGGEEAAATPTVTVGTWPTPMPETPRTLPQEFDVMAELSLESQRVWGKLDKEERLQKLSRLASITFHKAYVWQRADAVPKDVAARLLEHMKGMPDYEGPIAPTPARGPGPVARAANMAHLSVLRDALERAGIAAVRKTESGDVLVHQPTLSDMGFRGPRAVDELTGPELQEAVERLQVVLETANSPTGGVS